MSQTFLHLLKHNRKVALPSCWTTYWRNQKRRRGYGKTREHKRRFVVRRETRDALRKKLRGRRKLRGARKKRKRGLNKKRKGKRRQGRFGSGIWRLTQLKRNSRRRTGGRRGKRISRQCEATGRDEKGSWQSRRRQRRLRENWRS